jgi:hypothetical protein
MKLQELDQHLIARMRADHKKNLWEFRIRTAITIALLLGTFAACIHFRNLLPLVMLWLALALFPKKKAYKQ